MLTEAKNNLKIMFLSIKYNFMKSMENHAAFLTSVIMMIFNNATFIIQWITIFSIKETMGGYTLNDVMLFWAIASGSLGLSHLLFFGVSKIPDYIEEGKLDAYLTQPKNVLCSVITSSLDPSALGDVLYGFIALIIFNFSIKNLIIYPILIIFGCLIYTSMCIIYLSLTFKYTRSSYFTEAIRDVFINLSLYPDVIFPNIIKFLAYTLIPSGLAIWIPVHIIMNFTISKLLILIGSTIFIILLAFYTFNRGLKKYTSSNLVSARI